MRPFSARLLNQWPKPAAGYLVATPEKISVGQTYLATDITILLYSELRIELWGPYPVKGGAKRRAFLGDPLGLRYPTRYVLLIQHPAQNYRFEFEFESRESWGRWTALEKAWALRGIEVIHKQ